MVDVRYPENVTCLIIPHPVQSGRGVERWGCGRGGDVEVGVVGCEDVRHGGAT